MTRPRQDSNLRTRLRRPVLYPLSYGGVRMMVRPRSVNSPTLDTLSTMAEENRNGGDDGGNDRLARHTGYGVSAGLALGTFLFVMTDNPIWIALGLAFGAGLGAAFSSARDD